MTAVTANYNAWYYQIDDSSDFVLISEPSITLKLLDINYATFVSPVKIDVNTYVTIYYLQKQSAFYGQVTQCKQLNRNVDGKTRYEIELAEPAAQLKNKYMTSQNITGLYILNDASTRTLGQYVATILSGMSGEWQDKSDATVKDEHLLPTGEPIPSMGFSCSTVWSALQRLVVNQFNYGIWFRYVKATDNTVTRQIRYGEWNNTFMDWPVPLSIKVVESSINYTVDGVVVYGDDNTLKSYSPNSSSITPDNRIICYRYNQCQNKEELQSVANRIYADRGNIRSRYEIEFPVTIDILKIQEGDRIFISDSSVGMAAQPDGYGVKDVRITTDRVIVGVGAANITIFDVLADRLSVIDGDILSYNNKEINIGSITVPSNDTSEALYGATSDADFTIEGTTFFGELTLTPKLTSPGRDGAGYFTCFILATAPTSDLVVTNTPTIYDLIVDENGDPIPEYFPWSWRWVEMEVSYIFASTGNVVGTQVAWDAEWANMEIFDDGITQMSSSIRRTITHKWFIGERNVTEYSNPSISVVHAGDGTTATLKDVFIKIAVYYDGEYIEGSFTFNGDVQMRILSPQSEGSLTYIPVTNWITIYDSTDPDAYYNVDTNTWKTYTMEDLGLNLTTMGVGAHRIEYKCRGDSNIGVATYGEYLSFDENVSLVDSTKGITYDY